MSFDLHHIWASMGLASKLVACALILMAVVSLGVVVERMLAFARGRRATARFAAEATRHLDVWNLDALRQSAEKHSASPVARLLGAATRKYLEAESDTGNVTPVELARREVARKREAISASLRQGMSVLASVGSVAPFIGLLGTVVGIINAFQGIAKTGSGGLGSVSAGISEALVETALGLLVAIPAVLLFNWLSTRVAHIERELERAASELLDEMENQHGRSSHIELAKAA